MSQIIVHDNGNGGVSICIPSGDLPIDEILKKDCPEGSFICDSGVLPSGTDAEFFNAWEINGQTVTVSMNKAKDIQLTALNKKARIESAHRQTNALSGIDNKLSDQEWLDLLSTARGAIASSTTTGNLITAVEPVDAAIAANAG